MRKRGRYVLSSTFPNRVDAVEETLRVDAVRDGGNPLRKAAGHLAVASDALGDGAAAPAYRVLSLLFEAAACLLDWGSAVRNAAPEAARFLTAAKQRARDCGTEMPEEVQRLLPELTLWVEKMESVNDVGDVPTMISELTSTPLPLGVFRVEPHIPLRRGPDSSPSEPVRAEAAVATFKIDGAPVSEPQAVAPDVMHDLSVEIRLSGWPEAADGVRLELASVERPEHYEMPDFHFARPEAEPPFLLQDTRRMRLRVSQSLLSRPMEFHYALRFVPASAAARGSVEGQRTLHLEAINPAAQMLTGYPNLDRRFLELRNELRGIPGAGEEEREAFLVVLRRLMQLAAQAKQDRLFEKMEEKEFQKEVRRWLRDDPAVGGELEEHPDVGGGETDLSFHGMRIELKVEDECVISIDDATKYLGQASEYVSTSSKRLGHLVVLECADKNQSLGVTADDVGIRFVSDSSIAIGVVVVRGNLPRPSSL